MSDVAREPATDTVAGDDAQRRRVGRRARILAVVVIVLLAIGAGRTMLARLANARVLEAGAAERTISYVKVATPNAASAQDVVLPGTLQGWVQAPIAARASGYVKHWTRDIGARVQKGELLAEIESPEVDQQLTQAIAARQQAAASLELAKSTVARWESLRQRDVVSQQELDERRSGLAQSIANLAQADANVQRLRQLEGFKRVVAPFAGVITKRGIDVGDLIDAGANRVLFQLAQTDRLRVYVNVPQAYAQLVKPGQKVQITQAELRGRAFEGEVARTSASIDAATRTMQVEVALPNKDGALLPGAYVQVSLPLPATSTLSVPTNALVFRPEGTRVAAVDAQGRVHLKPVSLGRNLGDAVEVLDGVSPIDRLVLNPADSLNDGDTVSVAPTGRQRSAARAPAATPKSAP